MGGSQIDEEQAFALQKQKPFRDCERFFFQRKIKRKGGEREGGEAERRRFFG